MLYELLLEDRDELFPKIDLDITTSFISTLSQIIVFSITEFLRIQLFPIETYGPIIQRLISVPLLYVRDLL